MLNKKKLVIFTCGRIYGEEPLGTAGRNPVCYFLIRVLILVGGSYLENGAAGRTVFEDGGIVDGVVA